MRGKKLISLISYSLICTMLLTACGDNKPQAPELLSPVAVNESYRPVERGSIGDIVIRNGVVVPTDYCHFWTASVNVAEVKVNVGDYVEAGTVIALADTAGASENIASLNSEKSLNARQWSLKCQIYDQNKKELEYRLKGADENGDAAQVGLITTQLAVLAENHSYDELYYNHVQSSYDEQIAEQQKIESNGALVATHSGYVTYIKDLAESDLVNGTENLIIISDYEDCYIELADTVKEEGLEKTYPVFYTVQAGTKYMLKEYEYLPEELMTAQARSLTPPLRMKFESEGTMPEVGSNVPVFFRKSITNDVLVVGNDSLYQDDQGDFVYVKNGESREIRYVKLGEADTFYTEVISGLNEGELVYYTSDSILPESYEEYVVSYGDYLVTEESDFYSVKNTTRKKFYSEYEGQIESVAITQGQEVSVGELICVIRTNEGSATLTEMYNGIINLKSRHVSSVESFNKNIAAKEQEIEAAYIARQEAAKAEAEEKQESYMPEVPDTATYTDADETEQTTEATGDTGANQTTEVSDGTGGDIIQSDQPMATPGDAKEESPDKVSPYLYEELCCQLEVLKLNKQIEELGYTHQLSVMEQQYNEISCNNDGNGAVNIYALTSGKVTNLNLKAGKNVEVGDRLFNIEVPAKSVIELRSETPLQINQRVEFIYGDSTYSGTVIGISGNDGSFYFTHINNRVYISTNSGQQSARYFVKMDDEQFYDLEKDYVARFPQTVIKNAIVLPGEMVYQESKVKAGEGTVMYTYVWKLAQGELVKQYVQCVGGPAGSKNSICVVSGLAEGDILVREIEEESERSK